MSPEPEYQWSQRHCDELVSVGFGLLGQSYMMLFAIFMKALRIPLLGLAVSSKSSRLESISVLAIVTLGASIPVRRGALCPVLLLWPTGEWSERSSSSSNVSLSRSKSFMGRCPFDLLSLVSASAISKRTRLLVLGVLGRPLGGGLEIEDWRRSDWGRRWDAGRVSMSSSSCKDAVRRASASARSSPILRRMLASSRWCVGISLSYRHFGENIGTVCSRDSWEGSANATAKSRWAWKSNVAQFLRVTYLTEWNSGPNAT